MKNYKVIGKQTIEILIDNKEIVNILKKKKTEICKGYDTIQIRKDGTGYYYTYGYGNHNYGENVGDDVSPDVLDKYKAITTVIEMFQQED